jgi:hypothetical protein
LSRFGCNGSACHGKAEGQNGFKLSVFGNDPASDYEALVVSGRGRRVMPAAPEQRAVVTHVFVNQIKMIADMRLSRGMRFRDLSAPRDDTARASFGNGPKSNFCYEVSQA